MNGPTRFPIGGPSEEEPPSVATIIPWTDPHQHTQSLTWNDREKVDLSDCQGGGTFAVSYYWPRYRPVRTDDALQCVAAFNHFSVGVHAGIQQADMNPRYAHSYEEGNRNFTEPQLPVATAKRDVVEIDPTNAREWSGPIADS